MRNIVRTPRDRMLSPGDKVKDCEVIAPLGSGGMATLYLARRRGVGGFSRLVTLKLVHQHLLEDQNMVELFLDEARISAHVAHPNVVHVEEVGTFEGSYFIAMEYVHGISLARLLSRLTERRLSLRPKLCVWLAAQIAEALHAAHEAKSDEGMPLDIVHRDVSPQNVLLSDTGHVKLIDFGVARSLAEADRRCDERGILGKLRYMSPEQLRFERVDRRSDVYALGVMLWEMLTGRSLLRCQHVDDDRDWATRESPMPPSTYSSHPMPSLDRVVLKAIAFDPRDRYDSAFQFRAALLLADPAAVKLDAPMVAALMHSMLGDELDRLRSSWPTEVAEEFADSVELLSLESYDIEELTAENALWPAIDALGFADTIAAVPHSASDTFRCPPVPVSAVPPPPPRRRSFRGVAIGLACVAFGIFLGKLMWSHHSGDSESGVATAAGAPVTWVAPPPAAAPAFAAAMDCADAAVGMRTPGACVRAEAPAAVAAAPAEDQLDAAAPAPAEEAIASAASVGAIEEPRAEPRTRRVARAAKKFGRSTTRGRATRRSSD